MTVYINIHNLVTISPQHRYGDKYINKTLVFMIQSSIIYVTMFSVKKVSILLI